MSLATFFHLRTSAVSAALAVNQQQLLRRLFVAEWEIEKARLWADVERRMNFTSGIWRDIREGRCEL